MVDLSGKKIGIIGGSFDPIHKGHLAIAQSAYEDFNLDEVWFIPAGHSPNKNESQMTSPELRAKMVSLAIESYPYFKLSTMEIDSHKTSYTYLTLTNLNELYPKTKFYFIMGADSLDYFEQWMHPEVISRMAILLVAVRDHWDMNAVLQKIELIKNMFSAEIYPLTCSKVEVASHEIRDSIQDKDSLSGLPEKVAAFIQQNHLYQE